MKLSISAFIHKLVHIYIEKNFFFRVLFFTINLKYNHKIKIERDLHSSHRFINRTPKVGIMLFQLDCFSGSQFIRLNFAWQSLFSS